MVCSVGLLAATMAPAASAASTGVTGATGATGATGPTTPTAPAANPAQSSNWAGYAITGNSGDVRNFKKAAASWIEPTATCSPGSAAYSAFWVGLGGLAQSSTKLEQTGTEADCDSNGVAHYSAWYEPPVTLKLAIAAGDSVSATVSVRGAYVTMKLIDHTTGVSVDERLHFPHPDLSSAEWIAEAPSSCSAACTALPLTDFGSVNFAGAATETGNGRTGVTSNPDWSAQAIALSDRSGHAFGGGRFYGPPEIVTAVPTILDTTGSAFSVSWSQAQFSYPAPGARVYPGFGA
jgi:Peptidase A4 family